jgi:hypothetical protein
MYTLLAIDTVLRITAALLVLFVVVPALAWRRPATFSRMEWFWWNLGAGITILTLAGQLFTLLNIAGTFSYLVLFAAIAIFGRARAAGLGPWGWLVRSYREAVLFALRVLDGGTSVRARVFESFASVRRRLSATLTEHRGSIAALAVVGLAAAFTRFYRPFATANLGFPDTYGHLYLMRLLDQGRQIDQAWGPYPHGMHFLLLAIERLTNVDAILLVNFFGAFAGVLLTLAVADTARRATRSNAAALVAGVLFATMIGGASQYFAFGGSVTAKTAHDARALLSQSYADLGEGEFDVLLTVFQRQAATLPQELAIVLLFPATLFFLGWLTQRRRDAAGPAGEDAGVPDASWRLSGFIACTAAIAAVHSGVVVPLIVLCAAAAVAALITRSASIGDVARGAGVGAIGVALGSTWMLGFAGYRKVGPNVSNTAQYYFPFLRGEAMSDEQTFMMLTPFLIVVFIVAVILVIAAIRTREATTLTISLGAIFFILSHAATLLGIPELIEGRRNASWLAMSVAVLLGIAVAVIAGRLPQRASIAAPALAIVLWCVSIPNLFGTTMRTRLLDYTGYGATTYAVLRISHELQPFTWTFVSYGQEYPMVLGRGFHLNASDFVEQFDPTEAPLRIPTPHVFIAVEKTPHRFQIENWQKRFDRTTVEERLQTWCTVRGLTQRDIRVWLDDENVRIYEITGAEGRS